MRDFLINFNEKYQRYKLIIWFIVIAVVLFLIVTRSLDKAFKNSGDSRNSTTISESVSVHNSINNAINDIASNDKSKVPSSYEELLNKINDGNIKGRSVVELFIELCNNKQSDLAYSMLSDECKQILYPTKEEFVQSYYNNMFNINKKYEISNFKGDTYLVRYSNSAVSTGGNTSSVTPEYITVLSDKKINISDYVGTEKPNIALDNSYLKVTVVEKEIYAEYEVYKLKIENLMKADIYVNQIASNQLYLNSSSGHKYSAITDGYTDKDFFVASESSREIEVRFDRRYNESNDVTSIGFKNIKVLNKEQYNYETKQLEMTTYPETLWFSVYF